MYIFDLLKRRHNRNESVLQKLFKFLCLHVAVLTCDEDAEQKELLKFRFRAVEFGDVSGINHVEIIIANIAE